MTRFGNDPFAKQFGQLRPAQATGGLQQAAPQGPGLGQKLAEKAASKAIASQVGTAALTPVLGPAAPVAAPLLSEFGGKALGSLFFNTGGQIKKPLYPLQDGGDSPPLDPVQGGWNSFDDVKNAFSTGYYGTIPDARAAAPNNPKAQSFVDATDATYASRAAQSDPLGLDVQPSANKIAPVGVLGLLGRGLQELGLQNAYGSGALGTNDPVIGNATPDLSSATIQAGTNSDDGNSGFGEGFSDSGYGASDDGVGDFNKGGKVEESFWDKAKKAASKAWKNDNLRDPKHPWAHVGQNKKTLNMGGMIPQGYNAGGWVQARMQHLNHGGMAMDQAGMQAYNEMQGMTGEGTTMPGDMMPQGAMDPMTDFGYKPSGPLSIKDQIDIDKMDIQRGKAMADEARKDKAFKEGERRKEESHKQSMDMKKGPLATGE